MSNNSVRRFAPLYRYRDGFVLIFVSALEGQESITLSMGYTPAASRSGYQERGVEENDNPLSKKQAIDDGGRIPPSSSSSSSSMALVGSGMYKYKRHNSTNSMRDVAVRSKPLNYGTAVVDTFFACTGPGAMSMVVDDSGIIGGGRHRKASGYSCSTSQHSTSGGPIRGNGKKNGRAVASVSSRSSCMAEVAAYVAAGGVVPPGEDLDSPSTIVAARRHNDVGDEQCAILSRRLPIVDNNAVRAFSPCPALPPTLLFSEWNMLSSLARSMAYQSTGSYCEMTYARTGGPFERMAEHQGGDDCGGGCGAEAPFAPVECLGMIWGIANSSRLPSTLLSWKVLEDTSTVVAPEKVFDAHLLQLLGVAVSPAMGAVEKGQRLSEMLMDIVIDVVSIASATLRYVKSAFRNYFLTSHVAASMFVCAWLIKPYRINEGTERHQSLPETFLPAPIFHRRV
jgi:hypothetical protein